MNSFVFSILPILFIFAARVSTLRVDLEGGHQLTVSYYIKAKVSIHFAQNSYLRLPRRPYHREIGSDTLQIYVPFSINTYLWELNGYYETKGSGVHVFTTDGVILARIQIFRNSSLEIFGDVLVDCTSFAENPVSVHLTGNTHYLVKITFISYKSAPLISVLEPTGYVGDLYHTIKEVLYDPVGPQTSTSRISRAPSYFETRGFFGQVYLIPDHIDYRLDLIDKYAYLETVHQGYIPNRTQQISLPMYAASYIREFTGYFRPLESGKFKTNVSGSQIVSLIIGPKRRVKSLFLIVDDTWEVLDTRISNPFNAELSLERDYFYPFRLVVLANDDKACVEVLVIGPDGKETDLFGFRENEFENPTKEEDKKH